MEQHTRFSHIIRILQTREITAEALAEMFSVSIRTVYRDVAALRRQGVPIVGEPGIGYHLGDDALVEGLRLSTDEIRALIAVTRKALAIADPRTARTLCDIQRKIDDAMPPALRSALAEAG